MTAPEPAPLRELPPVDLATLNASAELLVRTDRKYLVPQDRLGELLDLPGLRVLELDGRRASRYESTYFDTPALASWAASAHPRRRRWKVRTRLYADAGECWVEVKTRGRRGVTIKDRLPHDPGFPDDLTGDALAWVGHRLTETGAPVDPHDLVPTVHTRYSRSTLLLPGSASRATIDADLTWSGCGAAARLSDLLVVETKSGAVPGPLDRRLWSMGHRPRRISKYGTGFTLLAPDLPANRWHRVIEHDLAPHLTIVRTVD